MFRRLDYDGTKFIPATDDSLAVIRFKTPDVNQLEVPYGKTMGGNVTDGPPFTGNGFTGATNGQVIPEFKVNGFAGLSDGAELYEITKDGKEILKAVYDQNLRKFIQVSY